MSIPRVLHRVWVGDGPIPGQFECFWDKWHALNPGWDFRTWRDGDLGWLTNRHLFEGTESPAGRSDIARYEVLLHGGLYVDCDVEPLKALDDELTDHRAIAARDDGVHICTAVMGCEANHPAVRYLVRALPSWANQHRGSRPNLRTGPIFVTAKWKNRKDVTILPTEAFYPLPWAERHRIKGGPYPPGSYAVHHWAGSWLA